jgi:hypothetical protein
MHKKPATTVKMSAPDPSRLLDPAIFENLKAKIEEEQQIRDELTQIVQRLERAVSYAQGILSRVHSTPPSECASPRPRTHPGSYIKLFTVACAQLTGMQTQSFCHRERKLSMKKSLS